MRGFHDVPAPTAASYQGSLSHQQESWSGYHTDPWNQNPEAYSTDQWIPMSRSINHRQQSPGAIDGHLLKLVKIDGKTDWRLRHCALQNGVLFFDKDGTPKGEVELHDRMIICGFFDDFATAEGKSFAELHSCGFEIVCSVRHKAWHLDAKTPEKYMIWVNAIGQAIKSAGPPPAGLQSRASVPSLEDESDYVEKTRSSIAEVALPIRSPIVRSLDSPEQVLTMFQVITSQMQVLTATLQCMEQRLESTEQQLAQLQGTKEVANTSAGTGERIAGIADNNLQSEGAGKKGETIKEVVPRPNAEAVITSVPSSPREASPKQARPKPKQVPAHARPQRPPARHHANPNGLGF